MSGYFTQSSTFSLEREASAGEPLTASLLVPASVSSCAAFSVIMVEMMQVIRIMITTPFSISSLTR